MEKSAKERPGFGGLWGDGQGGLTGSVFLRKILEIRSGFAGTGRALMALK
jgi:hypothetical protein